MLKIVRHFHSSRRFWLPLGVAAVVGLGACHGPHGYGRHSPERMERMLSRAQEDAAEELELRPEQRPAFEALTAQYRDHAQRMVGTWRETAPRLAEAVNAEQPDADHVGDLVKQALRSRPDPAETDALVDATVAFYKTLDPEQQARVREHLSKRLRRHAG